MPVTLTRSTAPPEVASLKERRLRRGSYGDRGRRLRIELVNNMPDSAVMGTQRQFVKLLEEAAEGFDLRLGLMTLTGVARSDEMRADMAELYRAPSALPGADGIVVTGAEPLAEHLDEEPYWRELTGLFDTARVQTHATLASCLAAHALALHESGVRRRRVARKWSGLYATEIATPHALLANYRPGPTPHSRWNGLDEAELVAAGYVVLTRAGAAGVDMFARDDAHLTLCFQGHPEYDGDTLAREFRRDVSRIPQGRSAPHVPDRYYDAETEARLAAHVEGVVAGVEAASVPGFVMAGPEAGWRPRAAATVANWLAAISTRKLAANGPTFLRARWGG